MANPHRQPTQLRKIKGTLRKDRMPEREVEFKQIEIPDCPEYLDQYGKQAWDKITKSLSRLGMLYEEDIEQIIAYCQNISLMNVASEKLKEEGVVITEINTKGSPHQIKNPWLSVFHVSVEQIIKISGRFGFSPSDRTKISMPQKKTKDDDYFLD